jgi:DNA excision repair protein ERCC-2
MINIVKKREIYFSHAKPRKYQDELIDDVWKCLNEEKHLIAHAPTGIGKTAAVLGPALTYALENAKTVFFLTPKIAQHQVAVDELEALAEKYKLNFRATDLVGRRYMCVDPVLGSSDFEEFYELCKRRRKRENCPYYAFARGFSMREKAEAKMNFEKVTEDYGVVKPHSEILDACERFKNPKGRINPLCAYEIALKLARSSQAIVCDYFHVLSPHANIIQKIKKELPDSILIIDETHNVPDRIRRGLSVSLDTFLLKRADQEAKLMGSELTKPVARLARALETLGKEKTKEKSEALVSVDDLPRFSGDELDELDELGTAYLEGANRQKSSCVKIKRFFEVWDKESPEFLRMIRRWKTRTGYTVSRKCLDPSVATAETINSSHCTIAMSGTLTPQEMYRDILGFDADRTEMRAYKSPFPKKNRLNVICDSVTTKYSYRNATEYASIAREVSRVIDTIPGNVAVFFPSYVVMNSVLKTLEPISSKELLVQKESSTPSQTATLLSRFKKNAERGSVLAAVAGGSFAEGMDYPGRELLGVIVVGVPLADFNLETQALIDYYEYKLGSGWNYGYLYPAMSKAIQSAGRCIRNEEDKGTVVFMDKRFLWKNYSRCFPAEMDFVITREPAREVRKFWKEK